MLISNKSNTLSVLLYCILTIILLSCGTETTSSKNDIHGKVHPDGNGLAMTFASPADLANALIGDSLQAEATVNGDTYPLNVNPDTNEISGIIPDIPSGSSTLEVIYFIETTERIVLCTFSTQLTVSAGQETDVIIGDNDLDRNHHNDNDGYTNLEEIKNNTDPLDPDDYPVTPPGPPTNVLAIPGNTMVTLEWGSVINASEYKIYMGTSSGVSKNNNVFSSTCAETSCYIDELTNGVLYSFVVTSINDNGESIESEEVNAIPQPCNDGDTRPCGSDIGECVSGSELCSNGQWSGICKGEAGPTDEVCDGLDNDCNGNTDETGDALCDNGEYCDGKETCAGTGGCKDGSPPCLTGETCNENTNTCENICTDKDKDGYSVEGDSCGPVDCDDNNADTYPDAPELCDKLDNDCDGTVDNGECPGSSCGEAFIWDCNNNCTFEMWLGDGTCDSDPDVADFTCINNDEGDCKPPPGDSCGSGVIYDCIGNCEPASYLGDGFICDNDTSNIDPDVADFTCINNDNGDCL